MHNVFNDHVTENTSRIFIEMCYHRQGTKSFVLQKKVLQSPTKYGCIYTHLAQVSRSSGEMIAETPEK